MYLRTATLLALLVPGVAARADVILAGDRIKLGFSTDDYHVTSFAGLGGIGEMGTAGKSGRYALWRIVLMSDKGVRKPLPDPPYRKGRQWWATMHGFGRRVTIDARADCAKSHRIEKTAEGVRLRISWKGIDVQDEKGVLDVTATVVIPRDSDLAFWKLTIANRSTVYGIWEYYYPVIEIAPPDPDLGRNFFVNTYRMGEVVPDPFHTRPDEKGRTLYDDSRTLWTGQNCKAGQFTALYGGNGRGFFFGPRDPQGWQKRFGVYFYPRRPSVRVELLHAPLNLGYPGEDCAMPYPVVAGFFKGDWYDACQVYRAWAIKQPWCRKGPVATRTDLPQWLKDCCVVLRQDTTKDGAKGPGRITRQNNIHTKNNERNFRRCLDLFGRDISSVWYGWWIKDKSRSAATPEFLATTGNGNDGQLNDPIPGVVEANRRIVAAGGYPMAYINGVIYDMGDAADFAQAKPAAQRDLLGDLYIDAGDPQACSMCAYAPWWQERYTELCRRAVAEFGFKGVYWDSIGKNGNRCFNLEHGHSYGGGPQWVQGERTLCRKVRAVMKAADPECVTSAEASSEEFIDLVDNRLCAVIVRRNVAPIFSAVYHDYQLFYGRTMGTHLPEPGFSMIAGYTFHLGAQLGRYFIHADRIDLDDPKNAEKRAFFKTLVEAKRAAKEFLNLGRMLRPPKMISPVPALTGRVWYRRQVVSLPAVLGSAWKSPRGAVALVFVNCGLAPIKFRYEVDTVEYGFAPGTEVRRQVLTPEARKPIGPWKSGIRRQADSLPGHAVKIIVLSGSG